MAVPSLKKKKRNLLRPIVKNVFSRVVLVAFLILIQILLIAVGVLRFTEYYYIFVSLASVISFLAACHVISTDFNAGYKIVWIIVVFLFQPVGVAMYYIFSGNTLSQKMKKAMSRITSITETLKEDKSDVLRRLREEEPAAARQAEYIDRMCQCPPYTHTETEYLPGGEIFLERMLTELEKAERYIFLEYFIIGYGEMWDKIHAVLVKKAASGVDVRVIYDDFGSIVRLRSRYPKELRAEGIQCHVFHPFVPVLDARQNNRDHRKICVIDGHTAFTGGINLGDEYINVSHPHGYWKDNAVLVRGDAAWSFALMFLTMWDYLSMNRDPNHRQYDSYRPTASEHLSSETLPAEMDSGYVQPYTDNPLDSEPVGENIYLHMLYHATRYVWITTPYLIIDEQMKQALCTAARSGVDVRIVTPGVPDKKTVYETTRSYYRQLIEHGVKIYEYQPGFIHAKTFVCDDLYATVGSVNLDFRSLYLHFECGVWMYKTPSIAEIKKDLSAVFASCRQVTEEECRVSLLRGLFRSVLAIISPML